MYHLRLQNSLDQIHPYSNLVIKNGTENVQWCYIKPLVDPRLDSPPSNQKRNPNSICGGAFQRMKKYLRHQTNMTMVFSESKNEGL